jgi:hypothetical protein
MRLEGGKKGKIRLEEGDRGGHGLKKGRRAIEKEEEKDGEVFFVQMLG